MTINAADISLSIAASADGKRYSRYPLGDGSGDWQLEVDHWVPAKMAMRLVHPSVGTTSTYIYENWYTGLPLDLPVCVQGGAWPFYYELTTAPSGMTVGGQYGSANYGRITWASPTAGSHSVAVRVTDQDGTQVTRSWTLTVGTSAFVFFDQATGDNTTGTGLIGAPYQNFSKWSDTDKNTADLNGKICIYRAGTYSTNATDALIEGGYRWPMGSNKPLVHMAYPGETVVFDFSDAMWWFYVGTLNEIAIQGIEFRGINHDVATTQSSYMRFNSADRVLIDSNTFTLTGGSPGGTGGTPENPSVLMTVDDLQCTDFAVVNNTYSGIDGYTLCTLYDTEYALIEGNTITGSVGTLQPYNHGFYVKLGTTNHVTIRNNTGLTSNTRPLVRVDNYANVDDVEICWNNFKSSVHCVHFGAEAITQTGRYLYRNTLENTANTGAVKIENGGSTAIDTEGNVIVHDGTYTDGFQQSGYSGTLTKTNNLSTASTDYVDASGLLQGEYRTTYLGLRGHEVD